MGSHRFDGEQRVVAEDDLYPAVPSVSEGLPLLVACRPAENSLEISDCGSTVRNVANVVGHFDGLVRVGSPEPERRVRRVRVERVEDEEVAAAAVDASEPAKSILSGAPVMYEMMRLITPYAASSCGPAAWPPISLRIG